MSARKKSFDDAKQQYVHRFTMEHVPSWAKDPTDDGRFYAPQFASDKEWYEHTTFPGEPGHKGGLTDCYTSGMTWPLGKWLTAPYDRNSTPIRRKLSRRQQEVLDIIGEHGADGWAEVWTHYDVPDHGAALAFRNFDRVANSLIKHGLVIVDPQTGYLERADARASERHLK